MIKQLIINLKKKIDINLVIFIYADIFGFIPNPRKLKDEQDKFVGE